MHKLIAVTAAALCICTLGLAGCGYAGTTSGGSALFPVSVDGRWGYMDRTGAIVIQPQFRHAGDFFDGFASVWLEDGDAVIDGGGFIGTTGTVVYQRPNCVGIGQFSEGLAMQVMRFDGMDPDTTAFYCDETGKAAFKRSFASGLPFHEGYAAVQTDVMVLMDFDRPEQWRYIDKTGAFLAGREFESAESFSEGLACVGTGGKYGYIDHAGAFAMELQFDKAYAFSEGLAGVMIGNRGGYIDRTGNWVIELADGTVPRGESSVFSEGLAAVWQDDRAGYIDKNGGMAIESQFYEATPFSEGLAAVCLDRDGPWGYIDKNGAMVIQPQYYEIEAFRNGLARVHLDRRRDVLAYVDKTGNLVWQGSTRPPTSTTSSPIEEQTTTTRADVQTTTSTLSLHDRIQQEQAATASQATTTTMVLPTTPSTPRTPTDAREHSRVRWGEGSGVCDDGAPGSLVLNLYRPEEIPDSSLMKNPKANKLVATLVEIGNKGPHRNAFEVIPSAWFFLKDAEGVLYSCQVNLQEDKPELTTRTLSWGETVKGYVVFEIPNEAEPKVGICAPFASDSWLTWSD